MKFFATACALLAFSIAIPVSALTWERLPSSAGGSNTWQKVCASEGPNGTWVKVQGCEQSYVFNQTITSNTNNYDLRAAAVAAGWNQVTPLAATVTVAPGVVVGATSTSNPAWSTGASFPAGTKLTLINNGTIAGKGGSGGNGVGWNKKCGTKISATPGQSGGPALMASAPLTVQNYGTIGGGGGGGGAGAVDEMSLPPQACDDLILYPLYAFSGGGGGGGGAGGGLGGLGALTPALYSNGGESYGMCFGSGDEVAGYNGGSATLTAPGTGGSSGGPAGIGPASLAGPAYYQCGFIKGGGPGGSGGWLGTAGVSGATPGGAPGAAVVGNGSIVWAVPGTRLGPIQ